MTERLRVQVCYALPTGVCLLDVELDHDSTLEQAIRASGLLERHPEIDLPAAMIGVFGKLRQFSELARPGDRIEIYRPLVVDPKESRRRRAQHKSRATAKAPGG